MLTTMLLDSVGEIYDDEIEDAGLEPQLVVFASFVITFAVVRLITYSIREEWKLPFVRNVSAGGKHIHHLVPGIVLLLVAGYLGVAIDVSHVEIVAVAFGIGAALTLDEFALWLNLKDVYWSEEGRISIDAVMIAGGIFGIFALGWGFCVRLVGDLV